MGALGGGMGAVGGTGRGNGGTGLYWEGTGLYWEGEWRYWGALGGHWAVLGGVMGVPGGTGRGNGGTELYWEGTGLCWEDPERATGTRGELGGLTGGQREQRLQGAPPHHADHHGGEDGDGVASHVHNEEVHRDLLQRPERHVPAALRGKRPGIRYRVGTGKENRPGRAARSRTFSTRMRSLS